MPSASLILRNVRALTMDPERPRAEAVAVGDGRILAVGEEAQVAALRGPGTQVIDGGGRTLLPGFVDAHCHFLAYAAYLLSVDCAAARSIAEIQALVKQRAQELPPGQWLRAVGYHEADLAEGRPPNRWDLDAAVPHHPVRLIHRSGHACVLNSPALALCQIDITTEEPPGGYIDRDPQAGGEPTGLLLEMNHVVERHVPPLAYAELCRGAAEASRRLLARGVTALQDATPAGPQEGEILRRLADGGQIAPRLRGMVGYDHQGLAQEAQEETFVKIMVRELGDEVYPEAEALADMVWEAHRAGQAVAIHAVQERALEAALAALEGALGRLPRPHGHRIEHCALCPPPLARRLARVGASVVTQPSFLYYNGDRYLAEVPPEKQAYLYPLAELLRAGVPLAFGSDAPVAPPDPLVALYGAVARRSRRGRPLPGEGLPVGRALALHTLGAARACRWEELGSITLGKAADLLLLEGDPLAVPTERLPSLGVALVILKGEVAWGEV